MWFTYINLKDCFSVNPKWTILKLEKHFLSQVDFQSVCKHLVIKDDDHAVFCDNGHVFLQPIQQV
jgi:hypothetical protein